MIFTVENCSQFRFHFSAIILVTFNNQTIVDSKTNFVAWIVRCILFPNLRVRVYISFKFAAACSRLKSRFNHISLGWSLNKENCGLFITILFHCFSFLYFEVHSTLWGYNKWLQYYWRVAHRDQSWCQQRKRGTLEG